jgi:hypothetical protein
MCGSMKWQVMNVGITRINEEIQGEQSVCLSEGWVRRMSVKARRVRDSGGGMGWADGLCVDLSLSLR